MQKLPIYFRMVIRSDWRPDNCHQKLIHSDRWSENAVCYWHVQIMTWDTTDYLMYTATNSLMLTWPSFIVAYAVVWCPYHVSQF